MDCTNCHLKSQVEANVNLSQELDNLQRLYELTVQNLNFVTMENEKLKKQICELISIDAENSKRRYVVTNKVLARNLKSVSKAKEAKDNAYFEYYSEVFKKVLRLRNNGYSLRDIAETLNHDGFRTPKGNPLNQNHIKSLIKRRVLYSDRLF